LNQAKTAPNENRKEAIMQVVPKIVSLNLGGESS